MKRILKITPLALLMILCFAVFVNSAYLAPSYQLQPPGSTRSVGPPPSWSQTYGNTSSDYIYSMVSCSSGGYALVGYTYSYGAGNADAWLVRTDAAGNHLWNKTYGDTNYDYGRDIVALSDGFLIAGYSSSYTASYTLWLVRTDLNGNHLWNTTIGGSSTDYGYGLVECTGGGFTITGFTYSYDLGNGDVWLVHTDDTGNHLWNKTYGGIYTDRGYDLVECAGGGYAICGYTGSFGAGSNDAWLIRTDTSGNHLWNQTYGTTISDYGYSLVECSSGGFALAGRTSSYGVIGGAAWLVRTDASGIHQWNQTYDIDTESDGANAVIEYSGGGFALAGYSAVPGAFPPRNGPPYDALLIRTDSNGNMLLASTYGLSIFNDEYEALVECSNGDIVCVGWTQSYGAGSNDGWLTKTRYPLTWHLALSDQTLAYGESLDYDLTVASWFPVDTWTINDTTNFAISSTGVVSNALVLAPGIYRLQVTVNDTMGSELSGTFTVTVLPPLFSPVLLTLIAGVVVLIIVAILLLLYYFVLRKRK